MRRSDMIVRLAISLMTRLPEWEKQERLKFADELLSDLEIEGMIPPPDKCEFFRFEDRDGLFLRLTYDNINIRKPNEEPTLWENEK